MSTAEKLKKLMKKPPMPFNSIIKNGDKKDHFEGTSIEKPEVLTLKEIEPRIIADRMIYSLNKTISMLNILAHLPLLLYNDQELLKTNLEEDENIFFGLILNQYNYGKLAAPHTAPRSFIYESINKKKKARSSEQELYCDPNLLQIIYLLFNNKCIREAIGNADRPKTIPFVVELIQTLMELKNVVEAKLFITGAEETARDKRLRQAFKTRIMLAAFIKDLKQQLELQRNELKNELNTKVNTVAQYNEKIARHKEEYQMRMEKIIHDSENKMMHQCLESEAKQAALAEEAERVPKDYETLLDSHLSIESNLRGKRLKTEIQLKNWVTKYDREIGEKQAEYDELKKEYDDEKEAVDDLQEKLDEQESYYIALMEEKEAIEEKIYMEMAYKFLINRSARIIQRAWRAYRSRKGKRKGKKGKQKDKLGKKKLHITRKEDPNAVLEGKYKGDVFDELQNPNAF